MKTAQIKMWSSIVAFCASTTCKSYRIIHESQQYLLSNKKSVSRETSYIPRCVCNTKILIFGLAEELARNIIWLTVSLILLLGTSFFCYMRIFICLNLFCWLWLILMISGKIGVLYCGFFLRLIKQHLGFS